MAGRRDPLLLIACGASALLALTLLLAPAAPWRFPLAVFGGVWAPGYGLAALLWPRGRLSALERHALAAAAGLLLAPLAALVVSETVGFRPAPLAGLLFAITLVAAVFARRGEPEPAARSTMPSTRVTLWATGGALALSALLVAPSFAAESLPSSLAIANGPTLELRAGSRPVEGVLLVWRDDVLVLAEPVALAPGEMRIVALEPDARALDAAWNGRAVQMPGGGAP